MNTDPLLHRLLRGESACALVATLTVYGTFIGDWRSFALYFLVPDLSIFAYLINPKVGSILYNIAHSLTLPMLLAVLGCAWPPAGQALRFALIWAAHVHFDRTLGYGLKRIGSFRETHLGQIGRAP